MSPTALFAHHDYACDAEGRFGMVPATEARAIDAPALSDVPQVGELLRRAKVGRIILVHGTFAGNDSIGLMREFAHFSPKTAAVLMRFGKRLFDQVVGEVGNFAASYATCLDRLINSEQTDRIDVSLFHWSGENHHLGRVGGAIELLDQLLAQTNAGKRTLIWGHSHGGNVIAIASNLLGASSAGIDHIFAATRLHYRHPLTRKLLLPAWERVHDRLRSLPEKQIVDAVTFGTPLRYRWNTQVCEHLLHFVHHRSLKPDMPERGSMPRTLRDLAAATGGDYIQQIGIGGTDFVHPLFAWRNWVCERRLRRLLQPGVRRRDLARNLQRGHRVSQDGLTLLVDYPNTPQRWHRRIAGHGVYTRHEWLPFHLNEIVRQFYTQPQSK